MKFPWTIIVGLVLVGLGAAGWVLGAIESVGAPALVEPGQYLLVSGVSLLTGKGIDAVQERVVEG